MSCFLVIDEQTDQITGVRVANQATLRPHEGKWFARCPWSWVATLARRVRRENRQTRRALPRGKVGGLPRKVSAGGSDA